MKILQSSDKIQGFGGLNFVMETLNNDKILENIDTHLGTRGSRAHYSYSELFSNLLGIFFCGGDCAEDLDIHLKENLEQVNGMQVCSPDTLLRMATELSVATQKTQTDTGVVHEINVNARLNDLLLVLSHQMDLLPKEKNQQAIVDFDHQFIACEKYDSRTSYKKQEGYFPGVCMINNLPLQIEGRNGNSGVKYETCQTIERMLLKIKQYVPHLHACRLDCGYYTQDIVALAEKHCDKFFIRAQRCEKIQGQLSQLAWEKVKIGTKEVELARIEDYRPFDGAKPYSLVLSRTAKRHGQIDIFTADAYAYRGILTNDTTMSKEEVVTFYNQRGACERVFDEMNNDFGWSKLPYSFLAQNTAFLLLTALVRNIFQYIKNKYSKAVKWITPPIRLKKFIFRFITVPAKWVKRARQHVLRLFTSRDYYPITQL